MSKLRLDDLLSELELSRYRFGRGAAVRVVKLLNSVAATHISDARSLIRLHECLLFLRAFPQAPSVVRQTEKLLSAFVKRVQALREGGIDMAAFDNFETSGIAGTQMEDTLNFDIARWLVTRVPEQVSIAWDSYDESRALGDICTRFIPLVEDDACVEADTPWQRLLKSAHASKNDGAAWLIRRFERLLLPAPQPAELYNSLRLPLRWELGNRRFSRTRNWTSVRKVFYHTEPLIQRSEVSLARELAQRPPELTKIPRKESLAVMDTIREVMLVRYRELYGTTLGDPASVVRADVGRGASIYLWNLPPERRLPLRAYVAGFTVKNGVPINYIEAIGLCEWMEVGFNTFYTFRGGEAGWMYAQALRCLCSLMGTTCISVYPYQLGHENDEAIESGAFWFYRKLGFRPGCADLQRLVEREERKIEARPSYRTSARTLRRIAAGHVFYELPGCEAGAWDSFSTRNIILRVSGRMAHECDGDSVSIRSASVHSVARSLGISLASWRNLERAAFANFALVLAMIRGLSEWTREEKDTLVEIIRAKPMSDEMLYLHQTQRHGRLREALLTLGSSQ
jgi:hypothetical protein